MGVPGSSASNNESNTAPMSLTLSLVYVYQAVGSVVVLVSNTLRSTSTAPGSIVSVTGCTFSSSQSLDTIVLSVDQLIDVAMVSPFGRVSLSSGVGSCVQLGGLVVVQAARSTVVTAAAMTVLPGCVPIKNATGRHRAYLSQYVRAALLMLSPRSACQRTWPTFLCSLS